MYVIVERTNDCGYLVFSFKAYHEGATSVSVLLFVFFVSLVQLWTTILRIFRNLSTFDHSFSFLKRVNLKQRMNIVKLSFGLDTFSLLY